MRIDATYILYIIYMEVSASEGILQNSEITPFIIYKYIRSFSRYGHCLAGDISIFWGSFLMALGSLTPSLVNGTPSYFQLRGRGFE